MQNIAQEKSTEYPGIASIRIDPDDSWEATIEIEYNTFIKIIYNAENQALAVRNTHGSLEDNEKIQILNTIKEKLRGVTVPVSDSEQKVQPIDTT